MKGITILLIAIILTSCTPVSNITSNDFVNKEFRVLSKGINKTNKELLTVCYNKYYNESIFDKSFNDNYGLYAVDFYKNMLVEVFINPEQPNKEVEITKIEENKDMLKIYYEISSSKDTTITYFIVETPKTKKPVKFYLSDKELETGSNIYLQK